MKLNLTLVSVIYVAWYLGRPRIETQMTYLHVLICPVIYLVKFANQYSLKFFLSRSFKHN